MRPDPTRLLYVRFFDSIVAKWHKEEFFWFPCFSANTRATCPKCLGAHDGPLSFSFQVCWQPVPPDSAPLPCSAPQADSLVGRPGFGFERFPTTPYMWQNSVFHWSEARNKDCFLSLRSKRDEPLFNCLFVSSILSHGNLFVCAFGGTFS